MAQSRLKRGFDPIWSSEFLDFKLLRLSKTAFILRQMYRLYRDPETNVCVLSDLQIRSITGWHLLTLKKAREQLIKLKEITPCGYRTFKVKPFQQLEGFVENAKPTQEPPSHKMRNQFRNKCESSFAENAKEFRNKCETHPITDRLTDIQTVDPPVNNPVKNQDEARHCRDCDNYEQEHLDSKGNYSGFCSSLGMLLPPFAVCNNCQYFEKKKQEVK